VAQHFVFPVEALDQKLIDGFLGKIIVQGFSEGFQRNFNPRGATAFQPCVRWPKPRTKQVPNIIMIEGMTSLITD
jgi:hypothetical protein